MGKYKYISRDEREWIEIMLKQRYSSRRIAEKMNISISTVNREILRGKDENGRYSARLAQEMFEKGIKRRGRRLPAPAGAGSAERTVHV